MTATDGEIMLTPNEHRVAEDRPECYWLYVVSDCKTDEPKLRTHRNPVSSPWKPVHKIQHFVLRASEIGADNAT